MSKLTVTITGTGNAWFGEVGMGRACALLLNQASARVMGADLDEAQSWKLLDGNGGTVGHAEWTPGEDD